MQEKLPYYMAYPEPFLFDDDGQDNRDIEYLKSLYPNTVKMMMMYVEEECDHLEYEGSMIYDEYPDQLQLYMVSNRIYDRVINLDYDYMDMMGQEVQGQQRREEWDPRNRRNRQDDRLRDVIQILLFQELMNRRRRHRRNNRRYY